MKRREPAGSVEPPEFSEVPQEISVLQGADPQVRPLRLVFVVAIAVGQVYMSKLVDDIAGLG